MIVMWVLIWILLGIFIILAALLLIPVSFSGQAGLDETASFESTLVWAVGLVTIQASGGQPLEVYLRLGRRCWRLQQGDQRGVLKRRGRPLKKFDLSWINTVSAYLDQNVLKEVFRYLFRLERSLDLKLSFAGEIGLGDPDLTGYLAGFLGALNTGQWECNLQPNFTETVLHFQGSLQGRVVPAIVLWLTGRLIFSQPIRTIWWSRLRKPKGGKANPVAGHEQHA